MGVIIVGVIIGIVGVLMSRAYKNKIKRAKIQLKQVTLMSLIEFVQLVLSAFIVWEREKVNGTK
jgi:Tfp pilus assembly protein PilE